MKRNCRAIIEKGDPNIQHSMSLYPKEWAAEMMDIAEDKGVDSRVHEIKGELLEISGDKGCIVLRSGVLLSLPLYHIQLLDT